MACGGLFLTCSAAISFSLASNGRVNLLAGDDERMPRGDLQRDVAHQLLEILVRRRGFLARAHFHQHADLGAGVDVGRDHPVAGDFHAVKARDLDVLADLRHLRRARRFQVRLGLGQQRAGDFIAKRAKAFVARDEIRLAIDLHQDARAGARLDALDDDAFVGFARRLLGGGSGPFFAQMSTAASRSPLASVRAFLHSIRPAPVISRSLPTLRQ